MTAYYNEFDPFAAAWLRELIREGVIPSGEVDERSITDVQPADLRGFTQCHFFAGIGGWSAALRLAGWPDDRPVWTGSCPCQPFSAAGKGEGFNDSRHLWPAWFRLIRECRPTAIFGEQVASAAGRAWLDTVSTDLEDAGYAFGSANLCAAGAGAPHIRQRLYFVGKRLADAEGSDGRLPVFAGRQVEGGSESVRSGETLGMADSASERHERSGRTRRGRRGLADDGGMGNADGTRSQGRSVRSGERADECATRPTSPDDRLEHSPSDGRIEGRAESERGSIASGCSDGGMADGRRTDGDHSPGDGENFWSNVIWLPCSDGKLRPTEPTIFPLASRVSGRVGILRGAGNSIVPPLAAQFILACEEEVGKARTSSELSTIRSAYDMRSTP